MFVLFVCEFVLFHFFSCQISLKGHTLGRFKAVDSGNRPTNLYSMQTVQSTALPSFLQKGFSVRHLEGLGRNTRRS